MIDATVLLRSLRGDRLATPHGRFNGVVEVRGRDVLVGTDRSSTGQPVKIAAIEETLARLGDGETIELAPPRATYRSAFVGAVLRTLPFVELLNTSPIQARVDPAADVSPTVLAELQRRLRMWADLIESDRPDWVTPQRVRDLGIYGGANGIWVDVATTRRVGKRSGATVSVAHTGRHYPDDVSDTALIYHYPLTGRTPGRDHAEVVATRVASELRLPVFVILHRGALREVRKAWVVTSDDVDRVFLLEFGTVFPRVPAARELDGEPFLLFEDVKRDIKLVRGRPNQQRFKVQVMQRYGHCCALCDIEASELLTAAHLVPAADLGTSDPRNGLPLCANHHVAFDRGLIAIEPSSTEIRVSRAYSAEVLGLTRGDLSHLPAAPALEALEYRWGKAAG